MLVFYNPHVDDFLAKPPHFKLLNRRALKKYGFVLDKTLENDKSLSVVIDGTISCFIPDRYFKFIPTFARKIISYLEFLLWLKINSIKFPVNYINVKKDNLENMLLLMFSYKSATGLAGKNLTALKAFPVIVAHLSHYFVSSQEKAKNLSSLDNIWLAGDSDISENLYFEKYFSWYQKSFIVLPFSVAHRFNLTTDFQDRKDLCVAAGSFHNLDEEIPISKYINFRRFFKSNTYHPVRKLIYESRDKCNFISSLVSPYRGSVKTNFIKKIFDHFIVSQKAYFKIDLVKEYNSHKFAVIGEELSGFPALGAFEAMACGAILIGVPESYKGMGFDFSKCCVTHDGSLEGIFDSMKHVNSLTDKGKSLSESARISMNKYFNDDAVFEKWDDSFIHLVKMYDLELKLKK